MKRTMPLVFALALSSGMAVAATDEGRPGASSTGGYESEIERDSSTSSSSVQVPSFSEADQDSSGAIEREELEAIPGIDFSSSDLDTDGRLSESEYESARSGLQQQPMDTGSSTSPGRVPESGSEPLNR